MRRHGTLPALILGPLLLLAAGIPLSGQESRDSDGPFSLEELLDYARTHNPEQEQAAWQLRKAAAEVQGTLRLESSGLTLSGSLASDSGGIASTPQGSISLALPVTDRFSLSGAVNQEGEISGAAVFRPFSLTMTTENSRSTLAKAEITWRYQAAGLDSETAAAYLTFQGALREESLLTRTADLAERQHAADREAYRLKELTYEELSASLDDLTSAREKALSGITARMNAWSALVLLLGPEAEGMSFRELSLEELKALLLGQEKRLEALPENRQAASADLETAGVDRALISSELKKTLLFQPDLEISAGGSFSPGSETVFKASLSLQISPEDFRREDRVLLEDQLRQSGRTLEAEAFRLRVEETLRQKGVETAEKGVELAESELERRELLLEETLFLETRGERTSLETESARIDRDTAENSLYSALAALYTSRSDYLALFGS